MSSNLKNLLVSALRKGQISHFNDLRNIETVDLSSVDLSGLDLRGANLRGAILKRTTLRDSCLDGVFADNSFVHDCNLVDASLSNAVFRNTSFLDSQMVGAKLVNAIFRSSIFSNTDLCHADLTGADFSFAKVENVDMSGVILSEAEMATSYMDSVNLCCVDGLPEGFISQCKKDFMGTIIVLNAKDAIHGLERRLIEGTIDGRSNTLDSRGLIGSLCLIMKLNVNELCGTQYTFGLHNPAELWFAQITTGDTHSLFATKAIEWCEEARLLLADNDQHRTAM